MKERIKDFKAHILGLRSKRTAEAYATHANLFALFCRNNGYTLDNLPRTVLQDFVSWLVVNRYKPASVSSTLSGGVVAFLRWSGVDNSGFLRPMLPKIGQQKEMFTLTLEQIHGILDWCQANAPASVCAMVAVLASTGARANEARMLRVGDFVKHDNGTVIVTIVEGKGGKTRRVPMMRFGMTHVARWLRERPHESEWLFPSPSNTTEPICRTNVFEWIKIVSNAWDKRITPHTFRRSLSTAMERAGISPFKIQSMLGHSSMGTTFRYVDVKPEDLVNIPYLLEKG